MNFLNKKSLPDPVITLMALLSVAMHLLFINNLEYHRDELLYFSLGNHPAFGYSTVPPLIGWIAWLMEHIFGYSLFAVRLLPALVGGVLVFLVAAIATELGGSKYAAFLASLGLIISVFFMRTFLLFQPVFMELFFWTLCIYLIIKYINSENNKFLILFGIVAGFALLNKYLAGMLFAGLILIIPFTQYRKILVNKMFWVAMACGFVIFLPNLIWQISKGFPVTKHMSELYDTQLVHMDIPLFITEQLIMPFAATFFTIAGLLFLLFSKKLIKFRFLGYLALFVITSLMLLKGKSYYTLGIFPLLIAAGAVAYENWIKRGWIRILFPVILVIVTIPVIPGGIPVLKVDGLIKYFQELNKKYSNNKGLRFEDGTFHSLPQDYADMLGWEELTSVANTAYKSVADKKTVFIYCENYGQAGAITVIGKKFGLPEAVCFSESFKYWAPEQFDNEITSLVYINDEEPGEDVKAIFKKIVKTGSITDPDAREFGTSVYLCQEPVVSFNYFWQKRVQMIKR
jgi:hypothetical protein